MISLNHLLSCLKQRGLETISDLDIFSIFFSTKKIHKKEEASENTKPVENSFTYWLNYWHACAK